MKKKIMLQDGGFGFVTKIGYFSNPCDPLKRLQGKFRGKDVIIIAEGKVLDFQSHVIGELVNPLWEKIWF